MDSVTLHFGEDGLFILNISIAVIMFGVALDIKTEHFKQLIKKPLPLILGVISQFLLLPLVTFLLIMSFGGNLSVGVAMGMILVASCPGGNVSNFMSNLANGNTALSVSLTAIATISAIVMTPLNFYLWGSMYETFGPWSDNPLLQELKVDPVQIFKIVFILLGIPIAIGMATSRFFKKLTSAIRKPIKIFSIVFFLGMIIVLFSSNYDYFLKYISWIIVIVLAHNALALSTGYGISSLFNLSFQNRKTIAIETGIQNSGLGLVLLFNPSIFPQHLPLGGMMIVVAWWGIWHIISGLTVAGFWNLRKNK